LTNINVIDHKKKSQKHSTHKPSFAVCMQFFILHDEYYFITNMLHMLKFTNVCWSFYFLVDFLKFKSNRIYFKQTKIIQDVMSIFTQKTKMQKCNICEYNFGGHNVVLPKINCGHLHLSVSTLSSTMLRRAWNLARGKNEIKMLIWKNKNTNWNGYKWQLAKFSHNGISYIWTLVEMDHIKMTGTRICFWHLGCWFSYRLCLHWFLAIKLYWRS
jgi:hypothetical protein